MAQRNKSSWKRVAGAGIVAACSLVADVANAATRTADEVNDQFNQTGRAMSMTVGLMDNEQSLGEVVVRIDKDDAITVSKTSLLAALNSNAGRSSLSAIEALPGDMLGLNALQTAGIGITFDKQKAVLVSRLNSNQRVGGDISLAQPPIKSGTVVKPASVSGYVNIFTEADYLWAPEQTALRFDAEAVLRVGDVVFESEFSAASSENAQLCPIGLLCNFDDSGGFKRLGSRAIYDVPGTLNRFTIGDSHTDTTTFQRGPDIGGIKFEHSPSKLDPNIPIRATGSQSFILEHPATVDVIINGSIAQRLNLAPGTYNLRDLPLRAGANDIELLINDNSGATQTLHFDAFSSATLLSAGASEWSMAAGVPSYYKDGGTAYVDNQIFGTGFYRYGLSDQLTLEAQAQGDNHVAMAGVGAVASTPFGIFSVNVATSVADGGVGVGGAAGVTWELANKENTESLRLSAEMHTDDFRTPGQLQFEPTGIILPVYDFKDRISATYNLALDDAWQAAVTARYDVDNPNFLTGNPLVAHGDRYHVDLSLSHPLFDNATISGTFGYSNEIYNRSFAEQLNLDNTNPEFWAGLRLIWRPDSNTTISASSDTLNRRTQTTGNYQTGTGIDDWAANVAVSDDRFSRSTGISADVNYHGQRAELTVGQDLNESTFRRSDASANQRTRLRVGTAFVFADGAAAIAAPVRGDGGFAILDPHVSIGDRTVTSGTPDNIRGKSDAFGPAVVSGLPGYSQQNLPIDVADLPTGYSLGESGFDLKPPYKAGYKLVVGSNYSVSALGELKDNSGDAVGLATGIASDGQKQVTVFTNQSGKFAADGLAPGEWKLVMDSEAGPLTYVLKIPSDTQGLLRLGTLKPVRG